MTRSGTKADGTLETRADGKQVIRFERRLSHPVERVWAALTEPDELIRWWGDADVELAQGGRFDMRWLNTDDEGNSAEMHATITELEPPHVLETSGDMHGVLRWELRPDGDGTLLTFTSTLELPDEFKTKVIAGWHMHLDFLAEALEGARADVVNIEDRWEPIHEEYVEQAAD
jgi:uncharacterized protein YndB with AHSA1/START domain